MQLYQSNRLETLLELLAAVVRQPQENPLNPDIIMVQSKGMGRWISLGLAERHGICANLQFPLPASYLWQLLCATLGDLPRLSKFSPEALTFRLMDWLAEPRHLALTPTLANYLHGNGDLRRFELARRIADLFDQYLVYRPDWIAAWERGQMLNLGPEEAWQALIWREMRASIEEPHRAQLIQRLLQAVTDGSAQSRLPERLLLFGISSLPPVLLDIAKALSEHCHVALFLLNPCQLPWGEIRDKGEMDRLAGEAMPEDMYLETGNPLLASLGKQGREFFDSLLDYSTQTTELFDAIEKPQSLLHCVQDDILNLVDRTLPELQGMAGAEGQGGAARIQIANHDRSLQVHVCHSPMREAEVLRDQLLALLEDDPSLKPAEIAVLTPNIAEYAPYIEAVFGTADPATRIPFAIADRNPAGEAGLLDSFLRLLDLPISRFAADWVMDLLEQPFLRQRFGIGAKDLPYLHDLVRQSGIRWGKDAGHRGALGLPAAPRHTWREGLDRCLLGYALPPEAASDGIPLLAEILPFGNVEGSLAQIAGCFAEFAQTLVQYSERLKSRYPVADWFVLLNQMLDELFAPVTPDEEDSLQQLRDALDKLAQTSELAEFARPVELAVVKQWLKQALSEPSGGGFLTGGVTFCAMVPMRSLPFRVVCLLGLQDEAYPRRQRPKGFDLIARHPRRGDRSRRLDDRYLFLETLLSARDTLYISYVGRNIRDNTVLPPSVLVADLLDVAQKSFVMAGGGDCLKHIVTQHPLQAFNPAYFQQQAKLPGFSPHWLAAAKRLGQAAKTPGGFFSEPIPAPEKLPLVINLEDLLRFFSNPARYLLRQRMGIDLGIGEEALLTREPFQLDFFQAQRLQAQILEEMHGDLPPQTVQRLAVAEGILPHGGHGAAVFAQQHERAERYADFILPWMSLPKLPPLSVRLSSGPVLLEGLLRDVTAEGLVEWHLREIGGRDFFMLWVKHLVLCLLHPAGAQCRSRILGEKTGFEYGPVDDAAALLGELLRHYWQGQCHPLPFFVKSSWAYAESINRQKSHDEALATAHKCWDVPEYRNGKQSGESENPYYQTAYRELDPLDAAFASLSLELIAPAIDALRKL